MRTGLPRHAAMPPIVHRPFSPSGPGGLTSLGPDQTLRTIPPPQEYYCVRIHLLPMDPNSNGGRDSNGYYVGYLEGMRYPPAVVVSGATPVKPECRVYYDSGTTLFADGTRLMGYQFQITTGSPTPADDGYMLLMPCYNTQPGVFGGFYTEALALTTSTANTAQFMSGGFISHIGVTLGGLNTGTVTIDVAGTYRIDAHLTTIGLAAGAQAASNLVLNITLNTSTVLCHDDAALIITEVPTHIDLVSGNPDTYSYAGAVVHLGLVFAESGLSVGDVLQTRMNLGTVGINGGQAFFFVQRIGD